MMAATPGGYASKGAQAVRADKLKRLYAAGLPLTAIAVRLGISPSTATETATRLGLRAPVDRGKKTSA